MQQGARALLVVQEQPAPWVLTEELVLLGPPARPQILVRRAARALQALQATRVRQEWVEQAQLVSVEAPARQGQQDVQEPQEPQAPPVVGGFREKQACLEISGRWVTAVTRAGQVPRAEQAQLVIRVPLVLRAEQDQLVILAPLAPRAGREILAPLAPRELQGIQDKLDGQETRALQGLVLQVRRGLRASRAGLATPAIPALQDGQAQQDKQALLERRQIQVRLVLPDH